MDDGITRANATASDLGGPPRSRRLRSARSARDGMKLAAIARQYQAILSFRHDDAAFPELLRAIGKATVGRVNYQAPDVAAAGWLAEELLG